VRNFADFELRDLLDAGCSGYRYGRIALNLGLQAAQNNVTCAERVGPTSREASPIATVGLLTVAANLPDTDHLDFARRLERRI
jgi:hypothetical protein